RYLNSDGGGRIDWLVVELLGVAVGGFVSAALAGRVHRVVERGPQISRETRLVLAFTGGSVMGLGAVLARGCTSGQALTGGALLSVGSWCTQDRKSTRLNSSHVAISYAVFCLKKKK